MYPWTHYVPALCDLRLAEIRESLAQARDGKERISESVDKSRVNMTAQNVATNLPCANK